VSGGRTSIVLALVALLVIVVIAYDSGKKCGAWESQHPGSKRNQALASKPLFCFRLH
jgi:hypothetical protein